MVKVMCVKCKSWKNVNPPNIKNIMERNGWVFEQFLERYECKSCRSFFILGALGRSSLSKAVREYYNSKGIKYPEPKRIEGDKVAFVSNKKQEP